MPERRNLIGAAAIAILGLGLGGLLSYVVALGVNGKPFAWDSAPTICSLAAIFVGSVLGVTVLWRFHVVQRDRLQLDQLMRRGNELLADCQDAEAVTDAVEDDCNAWADTVIQWLHDHHPHYEGYFQNRAQVRGFDDLLVVWRTAGRQIDSNLVGVRAVEELQRGRLQRLAEIAMRL